MFTIAKERRVWWPVRVSIAEDGGKAAEHEFEARFKLLSMEETKQAPDDGKLLPQVIVDLRGISREDGSTPAFSAELLSELIDKGPHSFAMRRALRVAYLEALAGAPRKNV